MLRKGGKGGAGVRSVQVASDSSLGEQLIIREEREIRERERMKQLTLEISERQEQEELSEALQQLQRVTLGEQIRHVIWTIWTCRHPNMHFNVSPSPPGFGI